MTSASSVVSFFFSLLWCSNTVRIHATPRIPWHPTSLTTLIIGVVDSSLRVTVIHWVIQAQINRLLHDCYSRHFCLHFNAIWWSWYDHLIWSSFHRYHLILWWLHCLAFQHNYCYSHPHHTSSARSLRRILFLSSMNTISHTILLHPMNTIHTILLHQLWLSAIIIIIIVILCLTTIILGHL